MAPGINDPRIQESLLRYNAGVGALQRGKLEDALTQFRQAIGLRPDDPDAHYNLGVVVGEKIRDLVDEKVAAYRRAVELRPGLADAHYHRGVAYLQKAQLSRAEMKRVLLQFALEEFRRFQHSAPEDPKAAAATHNIRVLEPQLK
jgi:tetratricopeptide (TPR) repeat protein